MSKFELLKFLGRGRRAEGTPVLDKTAQIEKIALNAGKIWFDRKKNKIERYRTEAEKLLSLITPELLEDSSFYGRFTPNAHIRVLQLLNEFVPKGKSEEFQSGPSHEIVFSYLVGLIGHKGLISPDQNGVDTMSMDNVNMAVRRLHSESGMPKYYLDAIFGENVGVFPERDLRGGSGSSILSNYASMVDMPQKQ